MSTAVTSGFLVPLLLGLTTTAAAAELWQSNAGGDDVYLYDTRSLQRSARLVLGRNPHGLATDARQQTVYVTLERNGESTGELLWVNPATRTVDHRLEVGPEPHQLAVTPDGAWAYVPCRDGHYWVVDTRARRVVKKIETGGRPHNTTVSADGRFMFLSPMGSAARATIVSIGDDHRVIGQIEFTGSLRPPAISRAGDRLFQHIDGLNGFEVADIGDRKLAASVPHSSSLGWFLMWPRTLGWLGASGLKRCHGIAVTPDDQEVWSVCGDFVTIHQARPPYREQMTITLPAKGYWLTFDRDGRRVFVALSDSDQVAVIDTRTGDIAALLGAGRSPKRNLVVER